MCTTIFSKTLRKRLYVVVAALVVLMTGCAPVPPAPKPVAKAAVQCHAAQANDTLVGNWLSISKRAGVAGELHTLITLMPNGVMAYSEQLKRGKKPAQSLDETGCWSHEGQVLILQTTASHGVPVELDDPIYKNRYEIQSQAGKALVLRGPDGQLKARRMPDGYRLPF